MCFSWNLKKMIVTCIVFFYELISLTYTNRNDSILFWVDCYCSCRYSCRGQWLSPGAGGQTGGPTVEFKEWSHRLAVHMLSGFKRLILSSVAHSVIRRGPGRSFLHPNSGGETWTFAHLPKHLIRPGFLWVYEVFTAQNVIFHGGIFATVELLLFFLVVVVIYFW